MLLLEITDFFGPGQALQQLISIKQTQGDDWARMSSLADGEAYQLAVDLGLDNFPYYLRSRGIVITNIKLALNGSISSDVAGWYPAALPEIADAQGKQPYEAPFVEDILLGLSSAEFVNLSVDTENGSLQVTLPEQLIAAIDLEVDDIYFICSYKIVAA